MPQQDFWNKFAKRYSKQPVKHKETYKTTMRIIKKYLKRKDMVLDYGCATGTKSIDIASHVKEVYGIDTSIEMVKIARAKDCDNAHFYKQDIFDHRKKYNAITTFYLLHLLPDPQKAIEKIHSLLKPKGYYISLTPCIGESNKFFTKSLQLLAKTPFVPNITTFTGDELKGMVEKHFKIKEVIPFDKSYLIVAQV